MGDLGPRLNLTVADRQVKANSDKIRQECLQCKKNLLCLNLAAKFIIYDVKFQKIKDSGELFWNMAESGDCAATS